MKCEKEFKALKKKYFIEQKVEEIAVFLLIVLALTILPLIFGFWNPLDVSIEKADNMGTFLLTYLAGVVNFLAIGLFLGAISMLFCLIYATLKGWIDSNWEEADDRARETLGREL